MNDKIVTQKVAGRRTERFLVGTDDGNYYRIKLPLRIKTVQDALDWLVPKEIQFSSYQRQGEFFFVREEPEQMGYSETAAGSTRDVDWDHASSIDRRARHTGDILFVRTKGSTMFIGRKRMKSHDWIAHPKVYARGIVSHPEHGKLDLGDKWHRVYPNKVHGPFTERNFGLD